MMMSKVSRVGFSLIKELSRGKSRAITGVECSQSPFRQYLLTMPETKVLKEAIFQKHHRFSSATTQDSVDEEEEQKISVTFVNKDGEEKHNKAPIGMFGSEAAHENDVELEGKYGIALTNSTCHVIVMDEEYYNKLEEATEFENENDALMNAFGITET